MALRLASNLIVRSSSARILRRNITAAKTNGNAGKFITRTMAVSTSDTAEATAAAKEIPEPRWDLERHFGYDSPNSKSIDAELDAIEAQCKELKAKYEGNMVGREREKKKGGSIFVRACAYTPFNERWRAAYYTGEAVTMCVVETSGKKKNRDDDEDGMR